VHWTRNLTGVKNLYGGVFDISNGLIEWNVGPNLTRPLNNGSSQICDDKICNITTTRTVDTLQHFGENICAGTIKWGCATAAHRTRDPRAPSPAALD
jgi:hypothetical protein